MRRRKKSSFKPSRNFVKLAVADYLKKGGKITKIESISDSYFEFMSTGILTYYVQDQG